MGNSQSKKSKESKAFVNSQSNADNTFNLLADTAAYLLISGDTIKLNSKVAMPCQETIDAHVTQINELITKLCIFRGEEQNAHLFYAVNASIKMMDRSKTAWQKILTSMSVA